MQVVGYVRTGREGGPALVLAEEGELERVPLEPGTALAYTLGERRCAGVLAEDRHEQCDRTTSPYCDRHADRWPCARCSGDCDKPLDSCEAEHAIYLAGFSPDVHKVGVTKAYRLETRLREQGAERAAHLRTVEDGRVARAQEAALADRIPDRVRVATKIAGLHREFDEAAWERLLADFDAETTFEFDYGLALETAPVPETTATGVVRGVKGRILVLEDGGTAYAVDLRDLVGYGVEAGATDRDRQASLGAFSE